MTETSFIYIFIIYFYTEYLLLKNGKLYDFGEQSPSHYFDGVSWGWKNNTVEPYLEGHAWDEIRNY